MKTNITLNTVLSSKFNKAEYNVQRHYESVCLTAAKKLGTTHIYYNGAQGIEGAIFNNQFAGDYMEAVSELAYHEQVSVEDITNDFKDWYYIMPIDEAIEATRY